MLRLTWIAAISLALIPSLSFARAEDEFAAPLPLYVVVPFGEPGDTDPVLEHATQQFSADLADRRVRSTIGIPTDAVEAVANAQRICTQFAAAGVLISEMRFSQTKNFSAPELAVSFIPWVGGAVASGGVLDRTPIHAEYKLYLVDCRGHVVWRTVTTAQKVHKGANIAAGLTEISFKAVEEAADQFAARRTQAH